MDYVIVGDLFVRGGGGEFPWHILSTVSYFHIENCVKTDDIVSCHQSCERLSLVSCHQSCDKLYAVS